jgi:hypothetical protein
MRGIILHVESRCRLNALPGDPSAEWTWSFLTLVATEVVRYIRVVSLFASSIAGVSGKFWDGFRQRQAILVGAFICGFVLIIALAPFLYTFFS